jgi:hypothetical protein
MSNKRKAEINRDDKIANFKERKEINLKIMQLEKLDDDKSRKEIIKLTIN